VLPKLAVAHGPGPRWVRTASGTTGPRRAPAVNVGESASQVRGRSPSRPRTAKQPGAGFESHLPSSRTGFLPPGVSGLRGPCRPEPAIVLCVFEHSGRWSTTLPLTRDSPSTQGDVPGLDPARAPPSKAVARRARLSGAAGGGLPCQASSATRGAPLPPRAGCAWSMLGHSRWEPVGTQRSLAARRSAGRGCDRGSRVR
jgi:hypothetical protein